MQRSTTFECRLDDVDLVVAERCRVVSSQMLSSRHDWEVVDSNACRRGRLPTQRSDLPRASRAIAGSSSSSATVGWDGRYVLPSKSTGTGARRGRSAVETSRRGTPVTPSGRVAGVVTLVAASFAATTRPSSSSHVYVRADRPLTALGCKELPELDRLAVLGVPERCSRDAARDDIGIV